MGSAESARVRETIVRQLEEIGLAAEIQSSKLQKPPAPKNVLARIKGQGPSGKKTLMLCAHYDSAHEGPGASDDAAGVAVVIETLRALQAGPPLERDVIALLTDGEEMGLLGARLFVDQHPWAKDVGIVLNFDARGTSGPSIMFETSDGNGWLIRQYAQATAQPLCTSVSMDVYKKMPNNSDMTIFKNAGMGGLNFAFGAGLAYYHTSEDTPENLDQRTLQHHGENALAAARHFGHLDTQKRGPYRWRSSLPACFSFSY
jgi:Zn-dependent M28 family amino/carboxypeptidase